MPRPHDGDGNHPVVARIIAAYEAVKVGDTHAAADVLGDLEHDLLNRTARRHACECGLTFKWPGDRDHHQLVVGCPWAVSERAA